MCCVVTSAHVIVFINLRRKLSVISEIFIYKSIRNLVIINELNK